MFILVSTVRRLPAQSCPRGLAAGPVLDRKRCTDLSSSSGSSWTCANPHDVNAAKPTSVVVARAAATPACAQSSTKEFINLVPAPLRRHFFGRYRSITQATRPRWPLSSFSVPSCKPNSRCGACRSKRPNTVTRSVEEGSGNGCAWKPNPMLCPKFSRRKRCASRIDSGSESGVRGDKDAVARARLSDRLGS